MSPNPQMAIFLSGVITAGFLIGSLFCLKFWRQTRDSLFAAFAVAFGLFAANQAAPAALGVRDEGLSGVYLLRLAAFLLIIFAILRKNLGRGGGR